MTEYPFQEIPVDNASASKRSDKRSDSGLTTLEWLLIVAAVAGLAALAVVLVQNVVDDTAEQIAGNNARITAAQVAAEAINSDNDDTNASKQSKCNRLAITYSDAFANVPKRTSLWAYSDTKDKIGGVCAIVADEVAAAISKANGTPKAKAECDRAIAATASDRGGKTVTWDSTDMVCNVAS